MNVLIIQKIFKSSRFRSRNANEFSHPITWGFFLPILGNWLFRKSRLWSDSASSLFCSCWIIRGILLRGICMVEIGELLINVYLSMDLLMEVDRKYNDIANWWVLITDVETQVHLPSLRKWTSLLSVFQGTDHETGKTYTVRTKNELSSLLDDPTFASAEQIQLVELIMDKYDAPRALRKQAELSGKMNKYAPAWTWTWTRIRTRTRMRTLMRGD